MIKFNQTGFTLVEIAIVLVIIGLLLGGILKGQELINSARVRNLADQNSAVQAAYFGFIDRYRQVPGDMCQDDAIAAIGTGDDGIITDSDECGNGRIDVGNWDEVAGVWEHLSKAGFITGNYQGASNLEGYRDAAPMNAFNGSVLLGRLDGPDADYHGAGTERLGFVFGEFIPVNIMRELDVKLDDGRPESGVVRMMQDGTTYNRITDSDQDCMADGIWDIETNSQDCNAVYLY
jgi:prepilin-type N-terminal cleavage/methylation domain-containing protein